MKRKRKNMDHFGRSLTYIMASILVLSLGSIVGYIVFNGIDLINWDFFIKGSANQTTTLKIDPYTGEEFQIPLDNEEKGMFGSKRYGIVFKDISINNQKLIEITYVHEDSPLVGAYLLDNSDEIVGIKQGDRFFDGGILLFDDDYKQVRTRVSDGAFLMAKAFDNAAYIESLPISIVGLGVKGSIITTLYLIFLTLLIALPLGVLTAFYLHEIAGVNKFTTLLRSFIDMLTGVPSIIYGLVGASFFIPLTVKLFNASGGNIISGSLTLAIIILPVIIKATESALDVVPKSYKEASLALGATVSQTTFKIMLPNALPGILSAAMLGIGRIMGESAALIYAIGTVVKDDISITGNGTSLAVHMWRVMAEENPNFKLASAMAIIILVVVLILNLSIKFVSNRFLKKHEI